MKKLLILGAGGHAKVVKETAIETGQFNSFYYLDDNLDLKKNNLNVVGKLKDLFQDKIRKNYSSAFIAIGNSNKRESLFNNLTKAGYNLPLLIHPTSWVSKSAKISNGSLVLANSTIQANVNIGSSVIINNNCSIDHDSIIKDASHICPGVNLAGNVQIGKRVWVGIGSSVIQNIKIGDDVYIGGGSLVTKSIPDSTKAYGVPAKTISRLE